MNWMKLMPSMSPRGSQGVAGLVIRTGVVELLALQGRKVTSRVRVPIEPGDDAVTKAIQQALVAAALKTKRLAVSIPSQDVLFRFFTIPPVPKGEYDAVVQFEARKYIPFKTELLVWDFRAISSDASKRVDVIFAATPRDGFRRMLDALSAAGIQPILMEPLMLSVARLLDPVKGAADNEFVCLVDVEPDTAHLAIVKNRMPYLTRDVDLSSGAGLPTPPLAPGSAGAAEAPRLEPVPPEGRQGSGVDPKAQRLLSELSVSMDFFMREHPSTTISRILLCGDEGVIGPWCRWLSEQLHCPVGLGHSLVAQRVEGELPLSFASAVGLLQGVTEPGQVPLDFLKRGLAKAAGPSQPITPADLVALVKSPRAVIALGVMIACLASWWVAAQVRVGGARRQLAQITRQVPSDPWGLSQMSHDELLGVKERAHVQIGFLKQVIGQRLRIAAKLDALARGLPDGVWLTEVVFDDQFNLATGQSNPRLMIQGACFLGEAAEEFRAIQQLEEQIKRNTALFSGFQTARLDEIKVQVKQLDSKRQYTYQTFQLNCHAGRKL